MFFPNPYFGHNLAEPANHTRFVTISNLPFGAKLKIFTIAGEVVKSFQFEGTDGFARWDCTMSPDCPCQRHVFNSC